MSGLSKTNKGEVSKPLPHDAAKLHVTGAARYVDDIPTPRDCLHLAFGLSSIAKGRITAMTLDAVMASPGVVAVLTAGDLPFANDVSPSIHDEPLLSDGTVNHLGQPVFLVIATSHRAARVAARKGQIEYEEQEALLTLDQALAANSRFEEGPRIYTKGDASAAIEAAPLHFGQVDLYLSEPCGIVRHDVKARPGEVCRRVEMRIHDQQAFMNFGD
jgi:xanthine dehydrogenase large subunit